MRRGVIAHRGLALCPINNGSESSIKGCWKIFGEMDDQLIFFLRIQDVYLFAVRFNEAGIPDLSSTLCIERGFIKYKLKKFLVLLFHLAVFNNAHVRHKRVVSDEFGLFIVARLYPVARLFHSICLRPRFLFLHRCTETALIYSDATLARNERCQVERKSIRVIKFKCLLTGDSISGQLTLDQFNSFKSFLKRSQKRSLFFKDDLADIVL